MKKSRIKYSTVGIFGLPCSGKTTIAKAVVEASKELIAHIATGDIARKLSTEKETAHMAEGNLFPLEDLIREETLKAINKRRSHGADIIILDGCPRFDDQVKWLLEQQLIGPETGCLVKILSDGLLDRALSRGRDDQDNIIALRKKVANHSKMIDGMERVIAMYGIPYYTIYNSDLVNAVTNLAKYMGLRK